MNAETLKFHEIRNGADLETLRLIRNDCRLFMTGHTAEINKAEQMQWWIDLDRDKYKVFLVTLSDSCVGYGVICYREGGGWLTGGLIDGFRDKGLGRPLFEGLIERSALPCWLDVQVANPRAKRLYDKLGFEEVYRTDTVITMRKP
jgi:GNAT superfamily N-acetyltransferase